MFLERLKSIRNHHNTVIKENRKQNGRKERRGIKMNQYNRKHEDSEINQHIFRNIESCLREDHPSEKLNQLSETKEFQASVFGRLNRMKDTEQSKQHHPEGNVWIHTMMVVDEASKVRGESKNPRVFMWAALLHDIGKPEVTRVRKGKITAYDHDKVGAKAAEELLNQVCDDDAFIRLVSSMVRWHMQILFIAKNHEFADLESMKKEVDIDEVALLGMCDRLGRLGVHRNEVMADIHKFQKKAKEL